MVRVAEILVVKPFRSVLWRVGTGDLKRGGDLSNAIPHFGKSWHSLGKGASRSCAWTPPNYNSIF